MPIPWWALATLAVLGLVVSLATSAGGAALQRLLLATDDELADVRPRIRGRILRLVSNSATVVPAAAFGRVFFQVGCGIALALLAGRHLRPWPALGVCLLAAVAVALVVAIVRPRVRGGANPLGTLRLTGPLLALFNTILWPIRGLLAKLAPAEVMRFSADELADLVERVTTTEEIEEEDRELLSSVVELGQTLTREVMVPRTEVVVLEADQTLRKAMTLFLRSGHSRVPVVGPDGLDDVQGVAYLKDTALVLQAKPQAASQPVSSVMRPAVFIPESKPADDSMRELQAKGTHIALVVDEYGGVAGLVTMEDLLEEIVGELRDEHDPAPLEAEPLGEGVFRVPARLELDELGDLFGLEVDDDDVDTVGGLLAKAAGRVPIAGTAAQVAGLVLTAERTEGRRKQLSTVLVQRAAEPEPEGEA